MTEKQFNFSIDHYHKMIMYSHRGMVNFNELGKAWEELIKIKEFNQWDYNLLSDYRNATLEGELTDIKKIITELKKMQNIVHGKKHAILINTPMNTALSMLFQDRAQEDIGFIVKTFSTKRAALAWLTKKSRT